MLNTEILIEIVGFVVMLVGVLGSILPLLPGAPLVFFGALLIAWSRDFTLIGATTLSILGVLALIVLAVDFIASALGAKKSGASKLALIGAVLGAILGVFAGIVGVIVGPFVGAVGGELLAGKNLDQAWKVGIGTWLGMLLGGAIKVGLTLAMFTTVVFAYFF